MAKAESDPTVKTTLRLPQSLLNAAKHRGIDEGKPLQDVIIEALQKHLGSTKGGRK